jgi:hypothetical protein
VWMRTGARTDNVSLAQGGYDAFEGVALVHGRAKR